MSLLSRLREKQTGKIATATVATFATQERVRPRTVATVAVAPSPQGQTAGQAKVGAGDTATASRWWRLHYLNRKPVEVACWPETTRAEILERYPDAVAAENFIPPHRQPAGPMTAEDETAIRGWLALIEETDPATIAEVIDLGQRDANARAYFSGRANLELSQQNSPLDDRRTCTQCANLAGRRCLAAKRGEIVASRNHEPISDLLQRCIGYEPMSDDPDRRPGRERWPGLIPGKG
jgi:hypothetical protein